MSHRVTVCLSSCLTLRVLFQEHSLGECIGAASERASVKAMLTAANLRPMSTESIESIGPCCVAGRLVLLSVVLAKCVSSVTRHQASGH